MQLKEEDKEVLDEINMTPLIDIMLVLLIIFMITSSIDEESALKIDLPNYSGAVENATSPIKISLQDNGRIFLQGEAISLHILEQELALLIKESPELEIILEGDKSSRLSDVVELMELATKVGAKNFSVAVALKAEK